MTLRWPSSLLRIVICLTAALLAVPAVAQGKREAAGAAVDDLLAIQLYAVGGGLFSSATNNTVSAVDITAPDNVLYGGASGGGRSSTTPFLGARVHVPMLWRMRDESHLSFSVFLETGLQSGFGAQSFLQPFQGTSVTAQDSGAVSIREYFQVPLLLGLTLPLGESAGSGAPNVLLDFYGGLTFDSWAHILQGSEANSGGGQGFFGANRRLTADPTVGLGVRLPIGDPAELPLFIGLNAELLFRPGSTVSAGSQNFSVNYTAYAGPYTELAVMARIGIAFGR